MKTRGNKRRVEMAWKTALRQRRELPWACIACERRREFPLGGLLPTTAWRRAGKQSKRHAKKLCEMFI